jgi:hypothetical protein
LDKRLRFMTDLIAPLRVPPGSEVKLSRDHDPGYTGQVARPQAAALLADGVQLLADYQDRLAAQDTFGVLLVLQGLDASGKDSTITHVMSGVNPQAVEVRSFKQPSAEELDHDFLWRHQVALPGRAGQAVPQAHRPPGEELEVLFQRRPGAGLLGRVPAGLRGHAGPDQHEVGAVVRGAGRPQVVQPAGHRRGPGDGTRRDQPQLPGP